MQKSGSQSPRFFFTLSLPVIIPSHGFPSFLCRKILRRFPVHGISLPRFPHNKSAGAAAPNFQPFRRGQMRTPAHVGIIPDGNRRWAARSGLKKSEGYVHGLAPGVTLLHLARESGVGEITYSGWKENTCMV